MELLEEGDYHSLISYDPLSFHPKQALQLIYVTMNLKEGTFK